MSFSAHSLGRKICDFDDLLGRITDNSKKTYIGFPQLFFHGGKSRKVHKFLHSLQYCLIAIFIIFGPS